MSLDAIILVAANVFLIQTFKKLPWWAKTLVVIAALLLLLLFLSLLLGIILVVVWSVYSLFISGAWKSLPAEVSASIVAGLFANFTLLLGNYFTQESQIRSAIKLKEIESQEILLIRKADFYSDIIDKLIALTQSPLTVEDILKDFYGKLYIQGSPKLTSSFLEIVESIKANGSNQKMLESDIRPRADALITELCRELSQARQKISSSYNPYNFKG